MAAVTTDATVDWCTGNPEGVHGWSLFEGGMGCNYCAAWRFIASRQQRDDPDPTSAIQQPEPEEPAYGEAVDTDLVLDVMNDMLAVTREDVSWTELSAIAERIVDRVRG